ncbi:hypothetical protein niasHT_010027 [Heterodera trifolii]|uniref:Uncharacterized protein n=1 Tax=Heterodera trifolii TaxID=157864 RepID=A0ABD2M8K7_9BILA
MSISVNINDPQFPAELYEIFFARSPVIFHRWTIWPLRNASRVANQRQWHCPTLCLLRFARDDNFLNNSLAINGRNIRRSDRQKLFDRISMVEMTNR